MKPGDLIIGNEEGHLRFGYKTTPMIGILLRINNIISTEFFGQVVWWDILREDGVITLESEDVLRVIS